MAQPSQDRSERLTYTQYRHHLEAQYLPSIRALISKDLSEPYSIYVYRYFLQKWDYLCYMVRLSCLLRRARLRLYGTLLAR